MSGNKDRKFSDQEKKLILILQEELPLLPEPYREIAGRVGLSQGEVLALVQQWLKEGVIRRFGATVRHQRMGYTANCMVVWRAGEDNGAAEAGRVFAGFPEVTHCYRRPAFEGWPYTLYTMVHGSSPEDIDRTLARMKQASGLADCRVLTSIREWKKISMKYFSEESA